MRRNLAPRPPASRLVALTGAGLVCLSAALLLPPPAAATLRLEVGVAEEKMTAVLSPDNEIFVEARPLPGEGLLAFSRRLCGDEAGVAAVRRANGDTPRLLAGVGYRVPVEALSAENQRRLFHTLFPDDRLEAGGWRHQVRASEGGSAASLWRVAEWFTGEGRNYSRLRQANDLEDDTVHPGQTLLVPLDLLRPALAAGAPAPVSEVAEAAVVAPAEAARDLEYGKDARGDYAVYRLRPGEALYSSVVVRFTGRIYAADVNALAAEIARRNGIADVTDIPIGFPVKIPFELLQPEFLPPGNPRRAEYEEERRASARFSNQVRSRDLAGITVVLDAGHGGSDVGASFRGVWESIYVYDIMVRVKRLLEERTAASVVVTVRDGEDFHIHDRDVLPYSRGHRVLTTPPYSIEDSRVGVNLRWYLANSAFRRATSGEAGPEKVVFISLHADSLHPSLRGAMVYIPDASLRRGSYQKSGPVYASRREYREAPRVSFSWQARVKSEGLSRQLAEHVMNAFRRSGLAVHPHKPVREKVIRDRRQWVPAVLRYNAIPASLLLEVCNLANGEDRRLLTTRAFRQRVAEAVAGGILSYYGFDEGASRVQVARTR